MKLTKDKVKKAGAGLGVAGSAIAKKLQNKKKAKFSSNKLVEFAKKKETELIGQFPKSTTKETKKKSVFDEASDKVKTKDKLPSKSKSDNVPENIKTGVTSKLLMRK